MSSTKPSVERERPSEELLTRGSSETKTCIMDGVPAWYEEVSGTSKVGKSPSWNATRCDVVFGAKRRLVARTVGIRTRITSMRIPTLPVHRALDISETCGGDARRTTGAIAGLQSGSGEGETAKSGWGKIVPLHGGWAAVSESGRSDGCAEHAADPPKKIGDALHAFYGT